jgi:hypothetical protein
MRTGQPYRDRKPAARRWWPILTPLALLAAGASLLSPAGRQQWALSLFRQPARYTVLSFTHASALPPAALTNEPITVSFMVSNHEGHVVDYRYVLTAGGRGGSHIVGESTRSVAAGAAWIVSTSVRPRCDSPCRIEVSLPGHPETIDFLVTITVPGA